jgi:hypothetical protein
MNTNKYIKHLLSCILFLLLFTEAKSQTISSSGSGAGNWSATTSWSGGVVPTAGADVVIQSGDNISVDITTNSLNSVTISATGTLTMAANTVSLTVPSGTITVNGLLTLSSVLTATAQLKALSVVVASGGIFQNSSGLASAVSVTNFAVNNGGTYNHDAVGTGTVGSSLDFPGVTSASINNIVLGATSTVNITRWAKTTGTPVALPTNTSSGIAYGNLNINIATLGGAWQLGGNGSAPSIGSVAGNFSVTATGGQEMRLVSAANTTNYTLAISGNLTVSSGTLALVGGGSTTAQSTVCNLTGNLLVNGGTIDLNSNFNATGSTFNLLGNLTISSGSIIRTKGTSGTGIINFIKSSGVQTISTTSAGLSTNAIVYNVGNGTTTNTVQLITSAVFSPKSVFNVLNAATLDFQTYQLSNITAAVTPGAFNLNSGGTLKMGDPNGITTAGTALGNEQMGLTRTYSTGGNYVYTGATTQVTGNGMPGIVNSLTISNTNAAVTSLTASVSVTTTLTISNGGTLDVTASNFAINVQGNWINNGTYNAENGTVTFNGTSQNLTGSSITTFYNNTLSSTTTVTLGISAQVNNVLNLAGVLSLSSNTITINNSSTGAISYSTGYIISETNSAINTSVVAWNMGTTTGAFVFPFGVAGTQIPFTFSKTSTGAASVQASTRATAASDNTPWAGSSDAGTVAAVTNMNDIAGNNISTSSTIDRWWDIYSASPVTADITFSYQGSENTTTANPSGTFQAQHWNGTSWDIPVGSGTGITSGVGTVAVTGASTFSPWVLSAAVIVLPIKLLNFTALVKNNQVVLNWSTASEINNKLFTIEKSADGISYDEVAQVKGAGNSESVKQYTAFDNNPRDGIGYYRLKQTDFNGNYTYSSAVEINYTASQALVSVYPNPASTNLFVNISSGYDNASLKFTDALGREVLLQSIHSTGIYSINTTSLLPGIYYVLVDDGAGNLNKTKIIIQK